MAGVAQRDLLESYLARYREATARETPMSDAATVRSSPIFAGYHRGLAGS